MLSVLFISLFSCQGQATVVEIRTSLGDIQVNLFDHTTPQTVANFLSYVTAGAYVNNVVHRVEPGFVIQSGGYAFNSEFPLDAVASGTPVNNEPELSNVRGTIAMAKSAGNPNSATSQWFINLANNSTGLDTQNGGYTVFGQVLGDGMEVVDAIAALNRFNLGGAASSMPLRNYTATDAANSKPVTADNLVLISDIVISDSAIITHPDIVPLSNTLIDEANNGGADSGSGGGALSYWLLLGLALTGCMVKRR